MNAAGDLSIVTATSCGLRASRPGYARICHSHPDVRRRSTTSVNVTVTRANPTSATGVTGTVTATEAARRAMAASLTLAQASTTPTLTITAPAATTTCTVSLAAGAGANLGTPNTFDLAVTAAAPVLPSDAPGFQQRGGNGCVQRLDDRQRDAGYHQLRRRIGHAESRRAAARSAAPGIVPDTATTPVPITVTAPAGPTTCVVTLTPGAGAIGGHPVDLHAHGDGFGAAS